MGVCVVVCDLANLTWTVGRFVVGSHYYIMLADWVQQSKTCDQKEEAVGS